MTRKATGRVSAPSPVWSNWGGRCCGCGVGEGRGGWWAWPALTDIHHQGFSPGRMSDYGEHGEEEVPAAPLVHAGVQGGDRRVVPARGPVRRSGLEGLRSDRDRGTGV